jgi:hypothetical protein
MFLLIHFKNIYNYCVHIILVYWYFDNLQILIICMQSKKMIVMFFGHMCMDSLWLIIDHLIVIHILFLEFLFVSLEWTKYWVWYWGDSSCWAFEHEKNLLCHFWQMTWSMRWLLHRSYRSNCLMHTNQIYWMKMVSSICWTTDFSYFL